MEIRTPIILRDIFQFLLPEKASLFSLPQTDKNEFETIISDKVINMIASGKKLCNQTLYNSLSLEPLEMLLDIKSFMELVVKDVLQEKDITWYRILLYFIFCTEYIKYLEANTSLKSPAQRIFQSCLELIETHVETWIRTKGDNWKFFFPKKCTNK